MQTARERYIGRQTGDISVPGNLGDASFIASGAGEYAEMCTGCHLAPGMGDTELRVGLYPQPPKLAEPGAHRSAAQQFWIIKHGLKMSGMPAWGLTHDDERIWSMVAFLQKLPGLTPAAYQEIINSGEGGHHHHAGMEMDDHGEAGAMEAGPEPSSGTAGLAQPGKARPVAPTAAGAAATVDDFQRLLAGGDTAAAARLLEPTVLIYEAGQVERSRQEYASHHLQADARFLQGARVRVLSRAGQAAGNQAWVATESELTAAGAKPEKLITTETMVLNRDSQTWRIAHIHWSSRRVD
ncbi:MAG: c-type cytochrome [Gammaproteobacteria bacterium]|nr:c-type cytochrome [Gammaproteobacteria bacterium]